MPDPVLSAIPLLLLAAALAAGAAGVDRALGQRDGERLFWTGFTSFLAVLLTTAWAAVASPAGAPVAGWLLVGGSLAAAGWVVRRHRLRLAKQERARQEAAVRSISLRHRDVLARWSAYELDPWLAAQHPALHDVRSPETRDFIRALKTAEQRRADAGTPTGTAAYAEAVDRLALCLDQAEKAAGGGRAA